MIKYLRNIVLFLLLALWACDSAQFDGYKRTSSGIYYQLHVIGDTIFQPQVGNYISANITYSTMNDSVFYSGFRKFQLNSPSYQGAIESCFSMLNKGDISTFIIDADPFFSLTLQQSRPLFIEPSGKIKITIELVDIQTEKQFEAERLVFNHWIEDFGDSEKEILRQYVQDNAIKTQTLSSGLMYVKVKQGVGKKVSKGDTIIFHYLGKFLDGVIFDNSLARNEPFGFVYGQQMQVVPGLEEGLGLMQQGEKAVFIITSNLAFGKSGSSTGIIPPFTTVIFEVDMLEVKGIEQNTQESL